MSQQELYEVAQATACRIINGLPDSPSERYQDVLQAVFTALYLAQVEHTDRLLKPGVN